MLCAIFAAAFASQRTVLFVKHAKGAADRLKSELAQRSDPSHPLYLQWLTRPQVEAILKPDSEALAWAEAISHQHGASSIERIGDKLVVEFAGQVPAAFRAATDAADALDGGGAFALAPPRGAPSRSQSRNTTTTTSSTNTGPQACLASMNGVTAACIRTAYGLTSSSVPSNSPGQAFVVNQGFAPADLSAFQTLNKLPLQPVKYIVGENTGKAGDEASLDSQYIIATGEGVPTTFVYLDGSASNPFTNWLVWAANNSEASFPKVHSLSLGAPENEVGGAIIGRMNTEMAALGVRGVTILFASGDSGYQPQQKFGAASPFVTAVGGVFNGELRAEKLQADSLSTGGFAASPLNKAGAWQHAAIAAYMKTTGTRPAKIDVTQRAVPDVSAYDDDISIIQNGASTALSGTSAACPIVAGIIASINGAIAAAGHDTTLGFVNPFLYANQEAFFDIVRGNNRGIAAVEGYDPISGLGTFSTTTFEKLKTAAIAAAARASARKKLSNLV